MGTTENDESICSINFSLWNRVNAFELISIHVASCSSKSQHVAQSLEHPVSPASRFTDSSHSYDFRIKQKWILHHMVNTESLLFGTCDLHSVHDQKLHWYCKQIVLALRFVCVLAFSIDFLVYISLSIGKAALAIVARISRGIFRFCARFALIKVDKIVSCWEYQKSSKSHKS